MVPFAEMGIPKRGAGLKGKAMSLAGDIHLAIVYGAPTVPGAALGP